jgi:MFS family permease
MTSGKWKMTSSLCYNSAPVRLLTGHPTEDQALNSSPAQNAPRHPAYRWYVVGVLTLAYISSFIDRQILTLLVGPMRRDLHLSDTQMSVLMGLSFALFYTVLGLPLGRLADSHSRRRIIAVGIGLWSLMTAVCGLAKNYWQLFLCRVGVGVGEAALSPAAYSLIADYFPPRQLATALSVYSLGIYIGTGLAYILGGAFVTWTSGRQPFELPVLGVIYPWQVVFFFVGLPGLVIALLASTIREPARKGVLTDPAGGATDSIPLREVFAYVRANGPTFLCHNLGYAIFAMATYGGAAWIPTFFIRTHQWTAAEAGLAQGLIVTFGGGAGVVIGGRLADWLVHRGYSDGKMRIGLIGVLACVVPGLLFPLVPTGSWAVVLLVVFQVLASFPFGAAAAGIQEIMPSQMRGQASALYLFVVNLVGLGLGPTAVALVTDYVFKEDLAVRYSLVIVGTAASLAAATLFWLGLGRYRRSLRYLREWESARTTLPAAR